MGTSALACVNMFSSLNPSKVSKFCWRHKGKIALASLGIGAVLGAAYYYYYEDESEEDGLTLSDESDDDENNSRLDKTLSCPDAKEFERRTNELIAVNNLFDFSLIYFLPTIKQKVKEVVDVTDTVKKLKELKNRDSSQENTVTKCALWREIMHSAFNSMLTSAYAVSGASLLLMVQMHILVRSSQAISLTMKYGEHDHTGLFRELMEKTFGSFFESGIQRLSLNNKPIVENVLDSIDWTVENTLRVHHEELKDVLLMMKQRIEYGVERDKHPKDILTMLFLGEKALEKDTPVDFLPSVDFVEDRNTNKNLINVSGIVKETWQVLESPSFERAFLDVTNSLFAYIFLNLWEEIFQPAEEERNEIRHLAQVDKRKLSPGSPNSPSNLRSQDSSPATVNLSEKNAESQTTNPDITRNERFCRSHEHKYVDPRIPLAKLLPSIKIVVFKLVPDDQASSTDEYEDLFSRLAPGIPPTLSTRIRSPSLQRIRSICGADDARSNSFILCTMILNKKY